MSFVDVVYLGGTSIDFIQRPSRSENITFDIHIGGGITNSAIISSKLGQKVAILSKVGKDLLGDWAIQELKRFKVRVDGVIQDPQIKTSIAIAHIDSKGNSRYVFYKDEIKSLIVTLKEVKNKNLLNRCKIFHFGSSFSYHKETYKEILNYIEYLKGLDIFISFDPNIRPYTIKDKQTAKERVLNLLNLVDMAKISQADLLFLTGEKHPKKG